MSGLVFDRRFGYSIPFTVSSVSLLLLVPNVNINITDKHLWTLWMPASIRYLQMAVMCQSHYPEFSGCFTACYSHVNPFAAVRMAINMPADEVPCCLFGLRRMSNCSRIQINCGSQKHGGESAVVNKSPQSRQRVVHIRSVRKMKMMKKSDTCSVLISAGHLIAKFSVSQVCVM